MYISRVEIDVEDRRKYRQLKDLETYHAWVEKSFPEEIERGERSRKLWRLDRVEGKNYLLLVSEKAPDLQRLERYGVPGSAETQPYQAFLEKLEEGDVLKFRATLNPVISRSRGEGQRGRVYPHVTADQQLQFLLDRSEKNGFAVDESSCRIVDRSFRPLKKQGERPVQVSMVSYEGVLKIIDLESFRAVLTQGLGKKKAYGCGLMTVIPFRF